MRPADAAAPAKHVRAGMEKGAVLDIQPMLLGVKFADCKQQARGDSGF